MSRGFGWHERGALALEGVCGNSGVLINDPKEQKTVFQMRRERRQV